MKSSNVTQTLALLSTLAAAGIANHKLKPRFIGIDDNGAHLYETYQVVYGNGGVPSRFHPSSNTAEKGGIEAALRTPRGVLSVLRNKRDTCQRGQKKCHGADQCCDGERCCDYGYCLDNARVCCPNGGCDAGKLCCGQHNCSPSDGACCRDESSCEKGNQCFNFSDGGIMCCTDKQCTAHVQDGTTITGTSTTATSTSTSKAGDTTATGPGGNTPSSQRSSSGPRKTSGPAVTDPGSSSGNDDDKIQSSSDGTALGNSDTGPNIGAIVGGVVGAVGGIALIALIVVCVLRRNKRTLEEIHSQHKRASEYQGSMAPRSIVSGHGQPSLRSAISPVTSGRSPRSHLDAYSPSPLAGAASPNQDWNALSARSVGASMGISVLGSPAPSQLAQSQHAISLRDNMTAASMSVRAASISAMPSIGPGGKPQTEICEAPTHIAELRRGPIHEAPTDMSDSHRGEMQEME